MCFYATSGPAFLLSWQRWRCRSPIVFVCVKIKVENLLYRFPLKYLCIVYYVSIFSFTAHLYYFIRGTAQQHQHQLLPTRHAWLRFVPQRVLVGFLPRRSRNHICPTTGALRDKATLLVVQEGGKCAIFTFYSTLSSLLQPTTPTLIVLLLYLHSLLQSVDLESSFLFVRPFISSAPLHSTSLSTGCIF